MMIRGGGLEFQDGNVGSRSPSSLPLSTQSLLHPNLLPQSRAQDTPTLAFNHTYLTDKHDRWNMVVNLLLRDMYTQETSNEKSPKPLENRIRKS